MSNFDKLLAKVSECSRKKVAVAVAQDSEVLQAVQMAKEKNIADAILVGDEAKIKEIADERDLTMERVRQIKNTAILKLRKHPHINNLLNYF